MLISELNITEFRGIRKCEQPIKLSKFTVLIGRNNVGKSAVLEALYMFPRPKGVDRILNREKISVVKDILHSGSHLAYGYWGTIKLEYTVNNRQFCLTIDDHSNVKLYIDNEDRDDIADKELKNLLQTRVENLVDLTVLIPNNLDLLQRFDDLIRKESFRNLIMKLGLHVKAARIISECVDDIFTDIYLDTMKIRKELPDGNFFYIHVDDLGDGIKKAIRVMLVVEALKPEIILWDDFEVSAHPGLIEALLRWLAEGNWQVVLTTHSIDVLYELLNIKDKVNPEDLTVLQLAKTKDDVLVYRKLTADELEDLLTANQDPRKIADLLVMR